MPFNELKHLLIGLQVAFIGHFVADLAVRFIVLVKMRLTDIEKRIVPDPEGLVYLKVKAN
jgi:23S rRNA maturation mini-RNase III